MIISEFGKPVTAKSLNESLAKRFGSKLNLDKFTLEQLQDARNKIRTQLFNVETMESFDSVQNDTYQKSKLMLDVLNAEISERGDIEEEAIEEKKKQKDWNNDGKNDWEDVKAARMAAAAKASGKKKTDEGSYGKKKKRKMSEGAEDHAELVMAAKDMVDRLTGWMEDTAEMQTESMLELADAIRDELGAEQAEGFTNTIKPALDSLYAAMESARVSLTSGVGMLTGEAEAPMMGDDDMDMDMEPTTDMDDGSDDGDVGMDMGADDDEFGAGEPAAGGDEPEERAKRESIDPRKLAGILSKKK